MMLNVITLDQSITNYTKQMITIGESTRYIRKSYMGLANLDKMDYIYGSNINTIYNK
jgi:hypothetical protein